QRSSRRISACRRRGRTSRKVIGIRAQDGLSEAKIHHLFVSQAMGFATVQPTHPTRCLPSSIPGDRAVEDCPPVPYIESNFRVMMSVEYEAQMDWLDLLIKIAAAMAALAGAVVAVLKLLDRRKLAGTKPNRMACTR